MTDTDIVTRPTPFEALVRRLAEEANTPETVTIDDLLQMGRLTSRYLERFAALVAEECAKLVEAETERILSKQDPKARPESDSGAVNLNLRLVALKLPDVASDIRAKFKEQR